MYHQLLCALSVPLPGFLDPASALRAGRPGGVP